MHGEYRYCMNILKLSCQLLLTSSSSVTFCCCAVRLLEGPSLAYGARRRPYKLSANVDDELARDCLSRRAVMSANSSSSQSSTLCRIGLLCANTCQGSSESEIAGKTAPDTRDSATSRRIYRYREREDDGRLQAWHKPICSDELEEGWPLGAITSHCQERHAISCTSTLEQYPI